MVRITKRLYQEAYEYIKEDSSQGNCILFVSADVDSLCAASILQNLLKADMVPHRLVPVSGYTDLQRAKERLVKNDDNLVSIIMINCGGILDALEFFDTKYHTKIYILDSHRPMHLRNLDPRNNHVCVLIDDDDAEKVDRVIDAYVATTRGLDSDSDDSEDDSEDFISKRRKIDKQRETHETSRHRKREHKRSVASYYNLGSSHGNSSAVIAYELANQLSRTNNDLLWLAITGVTAQYLYERIDTKKYIDSIKIFRDDTARFNIREEGSTADEVGINIEDEYRFMLLRHWSLYDSMYYSSYVSSSLSLWNDTSNNKLHSFFALMGFRLEQCRQTYAHMDVILKNRLRTKIEEVSPHFGLTELSYPSFTRSYDSTCTLSASDMVYGLSAMLETNPTTAVRLGLGSATEQRAEPEVLGDTDEELYSDNHRWWLNNFYQAHDALGKDSPVAILRGIRISMETQKAIASHVSGAISKRDFRKYTTFRYLAINGGPELALLQHPLALQRFALFASDVYRVSGAKQVPIILASFDEEHNSYLVVTYNGALRFGDTKQNRYVSTFHKIANQADLSISFDSVDPTMSYMKREDLLFLIGKLRGIKV